MRLWVAWGVSWALMACVGGSPLLDVWLSVLLPCLLQGCSLGLCVPPGPSEDEVCAWGTSLAGADVRWPGRVLRTRGSCAPASSRQRLFTVLTSALRGGDASALGAVTSLE